LGSSFLPGHGCLGRSQAAADKTDEVTEVKDYLRIVVWRWFVHVVIEGAGIFISAMAVYRNVSAQCISIL